MGQGEAEKTREELTGLLLAISIVSKRLAENLKKLDAGKEGSATVGYAKPSG
jgi:hypothetical protein